MAKPSSSFDYAIDAADRIAEVSPAWLLFARSNGAPELTREYVTGRLLWDFVAGVETIALYRTIFANVRKRDTPVVLPFRCDSPDAFRFMRLVVSHRIDGVLDLQGVLIREQRRPYLSILDRFLPASKTEIPTCSLCRRMLLYGTEWAEPEDAVVRLDLFGAPQVPKLKYTLCDDCRSAPVDAPPDAGASRSAR